jgi:hypothetical protein
MRSNPMNWNQPPDFGRRETLLRTLRHLDRLYPRGACVVETGTLRGEDAMSGDGWSTVAWGWFCTQTGGRVYTVDIDPGNLAVCRRLTAPYAPAIEYIQSDSVAFLRRWSAEQRPAIHLLYQDSFDYLDHAASEVHHLAEAEAALPSLAPACLVLFDDSHAEAPEQRSHVGTPEDSSHVGTPGESPPVQHPRCGGKGARAIPYLLAHGFQIEWSEAGQVLLSRGTAER